ncbi:di-heme oxidoredictase family protein [Capnocytophaga sp. H4358]
MSQPFHELRGNHKIIALRYSFLRLIPNYIHDKMLVMWLQGSSPIKALANQTFYPYTDMLLHDMGEDLADGRPDFLADGNEWKTRPLWGIGLQFLVNGHTEFLHDGRAKNVTEAILWHGGEAKDTKEKFKQLSKKDREDLLEFINSI